MREATIWVLLVLGCLLGIEALQKQSAQDQDKHNAKNPKLVPDANIDKTKTDHKLADHSNRKKDVAEKNERQKKRNSSLIKTESGENKFELPLEDYAALQDDDLPNYEPEETAKIPPIVPTVEEILIVKTKVTTKTLPNQPSAIPSISDEEPEPVTEIVVIKKDPITVTEFASAKMQATANQPSPVPNTSTKEGWVTVMVGAKPGEKNNANDPKREPGNYLRDDALPDAMAIISDLYDNKPIVITETIVITSKLLRTPGAPAIKITPTQTTMTSKTNLKKPRSATSRTPKINTNLIRMDKPFTIAPDDIFRGVHANSMGMQLAISSAIALTSSIFFLLLLL